jgi:hypothetical protein
MASTYNYLGIEKMATGENAGTWGTKTNTNLDIIQQASSGYHSQDIAGGAQTTALLMTDGDATSTADSLTNAARNTVIKLTGAITGNQIVTFPTDTEGLKVVFNGTTGAYTVQLKGASDTGSGTTFSTTEKDKKLVYMSGTDLIEVNIAGDVTASSTTTFTNKTFTAPKYADGGFVADANGNENLVWGATGSAVNEFKIANAATGNGPTLTSQGGDSNVDINITPKGTGDVVLSADTVTVGDAAAAATVRSSGAGTLTVTTGGATDLILSTNNGTTSSKITITDGAGGDVTVAPSTTGSLKIAGSSTQAGTFKMFEDTDLGTYYAGFRPGNLTEDTLYTLPLADAGTSGDALTSNASGTLSWTTISGGLTWVVKTTTYTASANDGVFADTSGGAWTLTLPTGTLSDEIGVVDYAATFDSNNLTVTPASGEKIQGQSADTTLTVSVERAGFTLVYSGASQGWLLREK